MGKGYGEGEGSGFSRTRVSVKARARARVGAAPPTWLKPSSSRSRPSEFIDEAPGEPCEVRVLG